MHAACRIDQITFRISNFISMSDFSTLKDNQKVDVRRLPKWDAKEKKEMDLPFS